jgi:hypothetical protein
MTAASPFSGVLHQISRIQPAASPAWSMICWGRVGKTVFGSTGKLTGAVCVLWVATWQS